MFSRNPLYRVSDGEAPPRMRAAFAEARKRLLPKVTEQLYASAKVSFDRREFALAAAQFGDLLTFLDDADARATPSLNEFRTLASGFKDLSVAAQAVAAKSEPDREPPPVAPPPAPAAMVAVRTAASSPTAGPAKPAAGVLQPPVILKQQMPLWIGQREILPRGNRGMLRVIIDEQGNVDDARIVQSVHAIYDALLLSATRTWKYEPATLDGKPVRYMKMIEVVLKPQ